MKRANILFFTVESPPVRNGGLWIVSEGIPRALNEHGGWDVRVVVPYYEVFDDEDSGWSDTGERIEIELPWRGGTRREFEVWQLSDPRIQNYVYGLRNEHLRTVTDLYPQYVSGGGVARETPGTRNHEQGCEDFERLMFFNHAAVELAVRLDGSTPVENKDSSLARFPGAVDVWMLNDWMSGPMAALPQSRKLPVGKLFVLHNVYDNPQYEEVATALGLPADTHASPLNTLAYSDIMVANRNFLRTLTHTRFLDRLGMGAVKRSLCAQEKSSFDMHHGIGLDFDPTCSRVLAMTPGFTPLEEQGDPEDAMIRYKRTNKLALQRLMGLEEDDQAVVYCWTSRLDRGQKGLDTVLEEFEEFADTRPDVQLILLASPDNDEVRIREFLDLMQEKHPERFVIRRLDFEQQILVNSGSDFSLMPSLYEPFGIAQLQAMSSACIPVAHAVDGLRTTLSDPAKNELYAGEEERSWAYGQTSVLLDPIPVSDYMDAIQRLRAMEDTLRRSLDPEEVETALIGHGGQLSAWNASRASFRQALERSRDLALDAPAYARVANNGRAYIREQHSWKAIAQRYEAPLEAVLRFAGSSRGMPRPQPGEWADVRPRAEAGRPARPTRDGTSGRAPAS